MQLRIKSLMAMPLLALVATTPTLLAQQSDQHENQQIKIYHLNATSNANGAEQVTALRNLLPTDSRIYYMSSEQTLFVRGSAEGLAIADKVLSDLEQGNHPYHLHYTITETSGGKVIGVPQQYDLHLVTGAATNFKSGSKVPFMTHDSDSERAPRSVQYVDTGISITATLIKAGEQLILNSRIENSSVAPEKTVAFGDKDPILYQFQLSGSNFLAADKPTKLGTLTLYNGHVLEIEVTAQAGV